MPRKPVLPNGAGRNVISTTGQEYDENWAIGWHFGGVTERFLKFLFRNAGLGHFFLANIGPTFSELYRYSDHFMTFKASF